MHRSVPAHQTRAILPPLRCLICGSVDDGKSTLIGRLLIDSGRVTDDQLEELARESRRFGTAGEDLDPALLLDGLEAERSQGITIDVAYRYFSSNSRRFIFTDSPGHIQYTRNLVTAASQADVAIVLADARKGILAQTRRHMRIAALMGIRHAVLAVNKMDLVAYRQETFQAISEAFAAFAGTINLCDVFAIPISARFGGNLINRCENMGWYEGPTLSKLMDGLDVSSRETEPAFRFPVQSPIRNGDYRGLAGTIASGSIAIGDWIEVSGTRARSRISRIVTFDGDLPYASAGDAVSLVLDNDIDVARGDILARPQAAPHYQRHLSATLIWVGDKPLVSGRSYLLRCGTRTLAASVLSLKHLVSIDTGEAIAADELECNDIGAVDLVTVAPFAFDTYRDNRRTGSFILIDRETEATVAAGLIDAPLRRGSNVRAQQVTVSTEMRAALKYQRPTVVWFTGLSGAGKSTLANLVEQRLNEAGYHTMLLDGDNLRLGLNQDLSFNEADRVENVRRTGEVARLMLEAGLIVLCSLISPFRADRTAARNRMPVGAFIEVFVDASLETCISRDPKGLYRKALAGEITNFTGIGAPYESPLAPDLHLRADEGDPAALAQEILRVLETRGVIGRRAV